MESQELSEKFGGIRVNLDIWPGAYRTGSGYLHTLRVRKFYYGAMVKKWNPTNNRSITPFSLAWRIGFIRLIVAKVGRPRL